MFSMILEISLYEIERRKISNSSLPRQLVDYFRRINWNGSSDASNDRQLRSNYTGKFCSQQELDRIKVCTCAYACNHRSTNKIRINKCNKKAYLVCNLTACQLSCLLLTSSKRLIGLVTICWQAVDTNISLFIDLNCVKNIYMTVNRNTNLRFNFR